MRRAAPVVALALALLGPASAARAQEPPQDWREVKCARYTQAARAYFARRGLDGLSADFLAAHDAFLTSGCDIRRTCPRTAADLAAANVLTVLAMNAGAASTFLPFACPRGPLPTP
ncbi:MAG: hypothetical protein IPL88_09550 [Rhizobiales bacterium]|nr:hypothetical protein [Hyphomicrobiales bacterium]